MRKTVISSAIIALSILASAASFGAGDSPNYKYAFEAGSADKYKCNYTITTSMVNNEGKQFELSAKSLITRKIISVAKDGSAQAEVRQKYFEADCPDKVMKSEILASKAAKKIKLFSDGGFDESELAKPVVATSATSLTFQFGDPTIFTFLRPVLPKHPVAIGDKWDAQAKVLSDIELNFAHTLTSESEAYEGIAASGISQEISAKQDISELIKNTVVSQSPDIPQGQLDVIEQLKATIEVSGKFNYKFSKDLGTLLVGEGFANCVITVDMNQDPNKPPMAVSFNVKSKFWKVLPE